MFSSSVNSNFPRRRNPEVRHGSASGRKNIASVVLSTTTPPPPASFVATYSSSSGVGFTRLVLRRTPPPPALVSRALCCDVPLLLRRWFHASGVATYPFSDVKSTRLLALVGNPWHETQPILLALVGNPWHETQPIPRSSLLRFPSQLLYIFASIVERYVFRVCGPLKCFYEL